MSGVYELQPLFKLGDPDRLFDSPLAERISTLFTMHASSDVVRDGETDVGPETEGDPYDDLLLAGKAKHPSSNQREKECENAPSAVDAPKIAPVEAACQHDYAEAPVPSKRIGCIDKEVDVALAKAKAKVVITMFCSVVISQGLATIVAMVMAAVAIGQALLLMFFSLIVMMWFMKSIIKDL
ncbi:uncharacterized protein J4E88_010113 [Alternaria novae-zelandiae]|uniref:uncharacterized protein n=1 Tax=Alternaria novae-zelandiae TaxID=430562 RepID=UPI0020C2FEC8|nr:uncharacterized protein J4E88_010113 [Alternaria novae-zelandiae]KAI4667712.1 hypothetical protein J4E88_010113 [Alternaria novae-zelandiae]